MTYTDFFDRLRHDAYNFECNDSADAPIQGWTDDTFEQTFRDLISDRNRHVDVCEVGTWLGKSADIMASCLKQTDHGGRLICIDTWLGAPEFWTWGIDDRTRGVALKKKGGYPTVFNDFVNNMQRKGHADVVAPFPLSSQAASDVLAHYGATFDVIYVDASHEYESVLADLQAFHKLLKPCGIIFGDDYFENWPGVVKAVDEFAERTGLTLETRGVVWILK